jgi:hypothetical protein
VLYVQIHIDKGSKRVSSEVSDVRWRIEWVIGKLIPNSAEHIFNPAIQKSIGNILYLRYHTIIVK